MKRLTIVVTAALLGCASAGWATTSFPIYVSESANATVVQVTAGGGVNPFASSPNSNLNQPYGVAFDAAGNLYVANAGTNSVEKFSSSGTDLGTFANTNLSGPQGIAFDTSGNLFVASTTNGTIEKFNSSGTYLTTFASGLSEPAGLVFDSLGNLYVSNYTAGTIEKFSSGGTDLGAFASSLSQPYGMAFDGSGNLFVATDGNNSIEKYASNGTSLGVFASHSNDGLLSSPIGLAFNYSTGDLYVGNSNNVSGNQVLQYTPGGVGSVFASASDAGFLAFSPTPEPSGVILLSAGFGMLLMRRQR